MPPLSVSLDQIQKISKVDSILFSYLCIYWKREALWHKIHILNCLRTFDILYFIMYCFTEMEME